MRCTLFIASLLVVTGLSPEASAQSVVSAGEHGNYSRAVFDNTGGDVSLRQDGRIIRLSNVNPAAVYDFQNINVRRKAHRIISAKTTDDNGRQTIELQLTCDCTVRTSTLQNGKFVVDIIDASSAPAPKSVVQKNTEEKLTQDDLLSVEEAHNQMVALLKEAAREGLITIRDDIEKNDEAKSVETGEAATQPEMLIPPENTPPPATQKVDKLAQAEMSAAPLHTTQVSAETESENHSFSCLNDGRFFIDGSALEDEPLVRIAELQTALAAADGENRTENVQNLVFGFLSIGFGEEALALLNDSGSGDTLFADIARIVAEQPVDPNGPLMGPENCRGAHALWQAASSEPSQAAAIYPRSGDTIRVLPTRLKRLIATQLASKMIAAEAWGQAEALFATASEGVENLGPELEYVRARLEKARGEDAAARDALLEIASQNNKAADDALLALADTYAREKITPHDGFKEDIGAVAKVHGSSRAAIAEASSWADLGNIEAALMILQSVASKSPEDQHAAQEMARTVLSNALTGDELKQKISALDAYVAHRGWLSVDGNDALRLQAARSAFDFALPNLAYALLDETGGQTNGAVLRDKAQAALAAGYANDAITLAAPYASEEGFAEIIVSANIDKSEYHAALAAAAGVRNTESKAAMTARAAWLARSWQSALRNYQALDPNSLTARTALQYALSAYMAQQKTLPAGAEAALSSQSEILTAGLRALFAEPVQGSALERSRQEAERTTQEIRMFEEILSDG